MPLLDALADLASIITGLIVGGAAILYWCRSRSQSKRLEDYLRAEHQANPGNKTHTVFHLMAQLGMTEAEILHANVASKRVIWKRRKGYDSGLAAQLLFEYSGASKN